MKIRILAFGIAKDILQTNSTSLELTAGSTVSHLKEKLLIQYPAFQQLSAIAFAVNEGYVSDDTALHENDEVVIIPPVSGG